MRTRENTNIKLFFKPAAIFIPIAIFLIAIPAFAETGFLRKVCFTNFCVDAEIADSPDKRAKGLMFRKDLGEGNAMLFVFEEEQWPKFWMKNVAFPLDMIWISEDKRITDIKTNVLPCRDYCESIVSKSKASYVLEVNAGFASRNGIKIGESVSF
ncbi:MAG: DUF192 domain-containing protein [Candidatus Omnitrophica bacterium]|nr:DUF192 domain-containing protein [Candidatus Omnitrophota bacterium]